MVKCWGRNRMSGEQGGLPEGNPNAKGGRPLSVVKSRAPSTSPAASEGALAKCIAVSKRPRSLKSTKRCAFHQRRSAEVARRFPARHHRSPQPGPTRTPTRQQLHLPARRRRTDDRGTGEGVDSQVLNSLQAQAPHSPDLMSLSRRHGVFLPWKRSSGVLRAVEHAMGQRSATGVQFAAECPTNAGRWREIGPHFLEATRLSRKTEKASVTIPAVLRLLLIEPPAALLPQAT